MSFPWTNLITAGSTLIAALGGASLTAFLSGRTDARRLDHEQRVKRRSERTDAYADFLRIAHADVRILRIALFRFEHGVPVGEEAQRMIDEAGEILVDFTAALARVEVVGSEEAAVAGKDVSEAGARIGLRLSNSFLSGRPIDAAAGYAEHRVLRQRVEAFAVLCRRELAG
jgi:hypothetical protein